MHWYKQDFFQNRDHKTAQSLLTYLVTYMPRRRQRLSKFWVSQRCQIPLLTRTALSPGHVVSQIPLLAPTALSPGHVVSSVAWKEISVEWSRQWDCRILLTLARSVVMVMVLDTALQGLLTLWIFCVRLCDLKQFCLWSQQLRYKRYDVSSIEITLWA